MKKGTIVYLDGIKSHLGEIDHIATIDGEKWYVMASINIEGHYMDNQISPLDGQDAVDKGLAYPVDVCSEVSAEKAAYYEAHRYEHF